MLRAPVRRLHDRRRSRHRTHPQTRPALRATPEDPARDVPRPPAWYVSRVPEFTFATCLPGLEPALKLDVAQRRPELRFAYSRPGLVTFRAPGVITPDDAPGSVFAHVWGRSIG